MSGSKVAKEVADVIQGHQDDDQAADYVDRIYARNALRTCTGDGQY